MSDRPADILTQLPARLRAVRAAQGLPLDAVAKLSGVSRSMVSQIERGESSPTIATLWNLTRALQVDFAGLLDQTDNGPRIDVTHADAVPSIENMGQGCRIRILSAPEDAGRNELYELRFAPGGVLDSQPHSGGARELLTVIEGFVQVTAGGKTEDLRAGDVARYAADQTHAIAAPGGPARAFLSVRYT